MERIRETEWTGGPGTAVIPREAGPFEDLRETAPSLCQWPTLAITDLAMRDVDAALAADPLFHRCPDGFQGRVDVRYWYFHPLNLSCRHCSEGGGVCVVEPATVVCRHRMVRRTEEPALEG
ncbi:MAG TPA: hypothetical protein VLH58_05305 [Candidatus Methylomirabilis sp.]|nr:hypothetical protein [Candidatus Methylomirabilis sp.]HSD52404.1 hypothetical protein [Candidatus Methylomirabilis sp.]